jgi:CRP-like cAMP-binding protein
MMCTRTMRKSERSKLARSMAQRSASLIMFMEAVHKSFRDLIEKLLGICFASVASVMKELTLLQLLTF